MDLTKRRKPENQKRFDELLNIYSAEPEHKFPKTETGEFDIRNAEIIDDFYDNVKYTDEEIEFMAEHDFDAFSNKFPGLSEYYMEVLDDLF